MGVVNEAVENGVGVSGVADHVMPRGQGKLRGDDRGPAAVSLLEDFEEVMTGAGVEGLEAEVVEDKEIGPAEGLDETRMPAVASSERQILTELGPAMIEDGTVVAAGFLADGAGKPAFADAAGANEREIVMSVDPFAIREFLEQGAVETAGGAIVDVFDAGLLAQPGGAQASREPFVPPP